MWKRSECSLNSLRYNSPSVYRIDVGQRLKFDAKTVDFLWLKHFVQFLKYDSLKSAHHRFLNSFNVFFPYLQHPVVTYMQLK